MTLESALSGEEEKSKTVLVTQSSGGVKTSPVGRPEVAEIGTSPVKKLPNRIEGSCQTYPPRAEEKGEDSGDDNTVCSAEDVKWLKREVCRLKQEAVESAKCATNKLRSARDQLSAREVDLARAQRAGEMAEIRIGEIDRELREAVEKLREEMAINERLETKLKMMVAQLSLARSESSGLRDEVVRRRRMMEKMDEREARSVASLERSGMALADTEGLLLKMEEQTANLAEDTERFLEEYARVCLNEERERMISNDLYGHSVRVEERRKDLQRVAGTDVNREESRQIVECSEVELHSSREEVEGRPQDVVILQSQARLSGVADSIDFGSDQMRALTEYVERMSAEYARVCLNEERERMISNDLYGHLVRIEERRKDLQRVAGDVAAKTDVVLMKEAWNRERREMMREDREGHLEALVEALVDLQASREIKAVEHSTTRLLSVGVQTMRVARWNSVVQASPRVAEVGVQSRIETSTVESQTSGVGKRNRSISRLTQTAAAAADSDDDRVMVHPVDAEHKAAIREEAIREIKAHMEEQVRITRCNGQVRLRAREESYRAEVERLGREHQRATAELERRHAEDLRVQRLRLERQWQVRRSMAEMSKKKETREAAVVPQPLRIDEDMIVTPRDEIRSSSSFNMHQVFDERPGPNAIRRASAARVVESVRSGRRRVIERTLRPK
ncbi:glutamine-asparagine rich protein, putative [Perkinsus marinus ATCC 50983]|uniref:Glutamine-asparagine rich protein, putative n=1 Tax=Perkinsus marinus (strain ATCC 50983 / TXsc) TaxID=423536 RepID=C5LJ87_PERM5|nr:glutamine-asparagine rich protein, putative [Perkinsus marinus ATCC 50983]EER03203.1 glutamine-asparagine rich protein, putative [Perkinsus marinus ATCC 50983]|eukprot:XP_002771387.1 glutamine-asparagine rich protein, putative [Perkinsus marinus ATCC 50983]